MTDLKFKLVIGQDGKDVHSEELGCAQVEAIASAYGRWGEGMPSKALIEFLSMYPSSEVRGKMANFGDLGNDVFERLAKDTSPSVIRELFDNDYFKSWVSTDQVIEYINSSDLETVRAIAGRAEALSDPQKVCNALLMHKDPEVRRALAGNSAAPKTVLKKLSKDADFCVRSAALRQLESN